MNVDYAKVIDICLSETTDFKAIVVEIAKVNPELVVAAHEGHAWENEAKHIALTEGKIPAIKFVRNQTGLSLKESKLIVDEYEIKPRVCPPDVYDYSA